MLGEAIGSQLNYSSRPKSHFPAAEWSGGAMIYQHATRERDQAIAAVLTT